MINDHKACRFDPASIKCGAKGADAQTCLSTHQIDALKDILGGARNSRASRFTVRHRSIRDCPAGLAGHAPGYRDESAANASLGRDTLRLFAVTPSNPDLDPLKFDFDHDIASTAETAAINDAVATLHTTFAGHGGKMIVYHGLSDQAMWTGALTQWYEKLTPRDSQGRNPGLVCFSCPA